MGPTFCITAAFTTRRIGNWLNSFVLKQNFPWTSLKAVVVAIACCIVVLHANYEMIPSVFCHLCNKNNNNDALLVVASYSKNKNKNKLYPKHHALLPNQTTTIIFHLYILPHAKWHAHTCLIFEACQITTNQPPQVAHVL